MTIRNPIPPGSRSNPHLSYDLDAIENILHLMISRESRNHDFYRHHARKALEHLKHVKNNLNDGTSTNSAGLTIIVEDYRKTLNRSKL